MTIGDQMIERIAHAFQFGDLLIDVVDAMLRDTFDVGAGARPVLVERRKFAAFLDGKAQRPRAFQKLKGSNPRFVIMTVIVGRARRRLDKTDFLIIPDRFRGDSGMTSRFTDVHLEKPNSCRWFATRPRRLGLSSEHVGCP